MVFLSELADGRDNNLNLIRAVAATAVLVSHAYPIALGGGAVQPLQEATGHTLGALAVFVFFAISGFLIAASFERSSSRTSFVVARVLRLMPGLLVNLLFVAFVMGPLVTALALSDYFANSAVYSFVPRNLTLLRLQFELPGVFQDLPYPAVVGSIWTLVHEVGCYVGVFLVGILGAFRNRGLITALLAGYALLWLGVEISGLALPHLLAMFLELSIPFALGMGFHVWRHRLPLSLWGLALTAALPVLLSGNPAQYLALTLAVGYWTFWLAYVPGGALRAYNRLGDYSYGIYVYAFPLQGLAVWLFGPQSALENMLYSFPMTLVLSVLSWHLVEAPAMRSKGGVMAWLRARPQRS